MQSSEEAYEEGVTSNLIEVDATWTLRPRPGFRRFFRRAERPNRISTEEDGAMGCLGMLKAIFRPRARPRRK
jgi:hypothetical protein